MDDRQRDEALESTEPLEGAEEDADGTRAVSADASPGVAPARSGQEGPPRAREEQTARKGEAPEPADRKAPPVDAAPADGSAIFIPRITASAFVAESALREALSGAASDRRMMRATMEIAEGDIRTAIDTYREQPTPELIIVESRLERAELFKALEELAELCPPGTRVILVGHENDVRLYRQLLKFGVGDYLVAPLEPLAVIEGIAQLFQEAADDQLGKVVAFVGARGGVGSSTVALNVATAIGHHCQASALLLDLDLHFGTAAFDLNLEPAQGIREALDEGERLDPTLLDRLTTAYGDRLGVLAAPCKLGEQPELDAESLDRLIETARTTTPHLLLDLPHAWSSGVRKALLAADEIVLTATPDLSALRNARNIATALRSARPNDPPPRLVLNGLGAPKRKELSPDDFERVVELEPIARIPHDPAAFSAASASGEPVVLAAGGAAAPFNLLARTLTGQKEAKARKGGVGGWMRRLASRAS